MRVRGILHGAEGCKSTHFLVLIPLWHNVAIYNVYLQQYKQVTNSKVFHRAGEMTYQAVVRTSTQIPSTHMNVTWGWWLACIPSAWEVVTGVPRTHWLVRLAEVLGSSERLWINMVDNDTRKHMASTSGHHMHTCVYAPYPPWEHEYINVFWKQQQQQQESQIALRMFTVVCCASFIAFLDYSQSTGRGTDIPVWMTNISWCYELAFLFHHLWQFLPSAFSTYFVN